MNLFQSVDEFQLKDGDMKIYRGYFDDQDLGVFNEIEFTQNKLEMYGSVHLVPRLEAWYGEKDYTYTGMKLKSREYPIWLLDLESRVETLTGQLFNSALINKYRDGNDHVSYHSDDEACLGEAPVIASLSFGGDRSFLLKHNTDKSSKLSIQLSNGDLLLMGAGIQNHYKHSVPKRKTISTTRYNITFRKIF